MNTPSMNQLCSPSCQCVNNRYPHTFGCRIYQEAKEVAAMDYGNLRTPRGLCNQVGRRQGWLVAAPCMNATSKSLSRINIFQTFSTCSSSLTLRHRNALSIPQPGDGTISKIKWQEDMGSHRSRASNEKALSAASRKRRPGTRNNRRASRQLRDAPSLRHDRHWEHGTQCSSNLRFA